MKKELLDSKKKIKNAYISMLEKKENPNVREMCRIAGVNKSTFYYYYPYLEMLEKELYKEEAQALFQRIAKGIDFDNIPNNIMEVVYSHLDNISGKNRLLFYHNKTLSLDVLIETAIEASRKRDNDIYSEMILVVFLRGGLSLLLDPSYSKKDKSVVLERIMRSYNKRIV